MAIRMKVCRPIRLRRSHRRCSLVGVTRGEQLQFGHVDWRFYALINGRYTAAELSPSGDTGVVPTPFGKVLESRFFKLS